MSHCTEPNLLLLVYLEDVEYARALQTLFLHSMGTASFGKAHGFEATATCQRREYSLAKAD